MQIETFQYDGKNKTWSRPDFPNLDSPQTLVLIFAAPEFTDNPEAIFKLAKQYPQSCIMGCSTAGEIAGPYISDHSLSIAIVRFEKTRLHLTAKPVETTEQSFEVGEQLMETLDAADLRGVFVLSEGLKINGSELVKGLNTKNRDSVTITGGLAGDGIHFKKTWTIYKGELLSDKVIALGFYGDAIKIGHGSHGGWDIFGPERRITRSKNNVLYELDNKPALELYKTYLGEKASGLPATGLLFPLAIRPGAADRKHLVRTILQVDEETNSLTFAGDMPQGFLAQLMRANFDRLITGASTASQMALQAQLQEQKKPVLLIAISCVGRRLLLGERTEEETEVTLDVFPENTKQLGFYSYGEISPFAVGACDLHNQTMTITSISED